MRVVVDGKPSFLDVTSHVGKESPYKSQVRTTVGSRVSDAFVSFSVLQVTKAAASRVLGEPLKIPRGTLEAVEQEALKFQRDGALKSGTILVKWDDDTYTFQSEVDDAGVVRLEPEFEDEPFEIPPRALRFTFFLPSPKVDRVLAVSFSGFMDRRPGEAETRTRAVLKALNNLSHLASFRMLSGIQATDMPPVPVGAPVMPVRKADDRVLFTIPVGFWDEDGSTLQAAGEVTAEVDLDHANAATGQLLYHVTTDNEQLNELLPTYKRILLDTLTTLMRDILPEAEQQELAYDIVLGQVGHGDIQRLNDAVQKFPGLDLTPGQFAVRA